MEDLILDIPKHVEETTVTMMASHRETFTKFLYWQAHVLHRRDPADIVNMERKAGMLIQIKLWLTLIGNAPRGEEEHPVVGKTVPPPEDWQTPIDRFKKREIPKKSEEK